MKTTYLIEFTTMRTDYFNGERFQYGFNIEIKINIELQKDDYYNVRITPSETIIFMVKKRTCDPVSTLETTWRFNGVILKETEEYLLNLYEFKNKEEEQKINSGTINNHLQEARETLMQVGKYSLNYSNIQTFAYNN